MKTSHCETLESRNDVLTPYGRSVHTGGKNGWTDKGGYGTMRRRLFSVSPPPGQILSSSVTRASRHSHTAYHAHSPLRPPTLRMQARFAAETRRILAIQSASRWTRHLASIYLHFICRYTAQLLLNALPLEPWHDSAPASGAKRNQRRSFSGDAVPIAYLTFELPPSSLELWPSKI